MMGNVIRNSQTINNPQPYVTIQQNDKLQYVITYIHEDNTPPHHTYIWTKMENKR